MVEKSFPLIQHTDLTDKIYEVLKEKILRRELGPGERLSVEDIAEKMGVSRTPVKDAMNRLANEGLVFIQSRRGTFVSSLGHQEVAELFEIRALLETFAAEQWFLRGRSPELLVRLKECLSNMQASTDGDRYMNYTQFMDNDHDFHRAIIASAGNGRLIQMYEELGVHIRIARAHYTRSVQSAMEAQREHEEIFGAFEMGNPTETCAAITRHVEHVKAALIAAVEPEGI